MTISSLIKRLEEATGPDRELDADLAIACDLISEREWWSTDYLKFGLVPCYTASVDAAIALAERVLGPVGWNVQGNTNIFYSSVAGHTSRSKATPAIALCIAVLRALEAKEAKP